MALVHYLYIGHFIPDQGYVRFQDHRPVVTRPLNMATVVSLLRSYLGDIATPEGLPNEWAMSIVPDYLVCDHFGSPAAALRFAADYAQHEGATILDQGSFSLLTPGQPRQSACELRQARSA